MFCNGRKKGTVRFAVKPHSGVAKVKLAGDFTDWAPTMMRKQKDGAFVAVLPVPPGTHEYKFLFDENWAIDPDNDTWALNPVGTLNSVAHVE